MAKQVKYLYLMVNINCYWKQKKQPWISWLLISQF